jgi:hypothetical protein
MGGEWTRKIICFWEVMYWAPLQKMLLQKDLPITQVSNLFSKMHYLLEKVGLGSQIFTIHSGVSTKQKAKKSYNNPSKLNICRRMVVAPSVSLKPKVIPSHGNFMLRVWVGSFTIISKQNVARKTQERPLWCAKFTPVLGGFYSQEQRPGCYQSGS